MLFRCIKQGAIQNAKDKFDDNKLSDILNKLKYFDYDQMQFTGAEYDVLDFSKESMFVHCDAIEQIICCFNRSLLGRFKPLSKDEEELKSYLEKLKKQDTQEKKILDLANFSGVTNARTYSLYETFFDYGKDQVINKNNISLNEDYFNKFMHDVFSSDNSISAIYHTWSGRLYFCNKNFSHRLAILCYIDKSQNKNTKIELNVIVKLLDKDSTKFIFDNYIGIITTRKTYIFLSGELKTLNIEILLEKSNLEHNDLYILWLEKSKIMKLDAIIKFIGQLPSDKCFIISNVLGKYL